MRTILVIEDDASIRLGLEDTLRAKGYAVRVAGRGEDGISDAITNRPLVDTLPKSAISWCCPLSYTVSRTSEVIALRCQMKLS